MKKLILAATASTILLAFTSCKKDYTCECTVSAGGSSVSQSYEMKKVSKKDAKKACDAYVTAGMGLVTCSLK